MKPISSLAALLGVCVLLASSPLFAQQSGSSGAGTETRLSALEDEMRSLNGQLEQLSYSIRRLDQNLQRMQEDSDARLTRVETTVATLQAAPSATAIPIQQAPAPMTAPNAAPPPAIVTGGSAPPPPVTMDAPVTGSLGAVKVMDGRVTGAVSNPKAPPLPQTPADYGLTPQEQYSRAFDLLRSADYDEAEVAFKTFIDKNPKDKMVDNAKYWYAETLYVRERFAEAATAFADAYQQNPQGTKAPDSLLKLSMSLAATDKAPDACVALSELKTKFPNASSDIRARAGEQRKKLKCPVS